MELTVQIPDWAMATAYATITLALVFAVLRLFIGPSLPDRIVALDLAAGIVMCFAVVHAIDTGATHYLDAALAIAVIAFIGTIAFSRYIEKAHRGEKNQEENS